MQSFFTFVPNNRYPLRLTFQNYLPQWSSTVCSSNSHNAGVSRCLTFHINSKAPACLKFVFLNFFRNLMIGVPTASQSCCSVCVHDLRGFQQIALSMAQHTNTFYCRGSLRYASILCCSVLWSSYEELQLCSCLAPLIRIWSVPCKRILSGNLQLAF